MLHLEKRDDLVVLIPNFHEIQLIDVWKKILYFLNMRDSLWGKI